MARGLTPPFPFIVAPIVTESRSRPASVVISRYTDPDPFQRNHSGVAECSSSALAAAAASNWCFAQKACVGLVLSITLKFVLPPLRTTNHKISSDYSGDASDGWFCCWQCCRSGMFIPDPNFLHP